MPPPFDPGEGKPVRVTHDPSGYVCEAVSSNRLSDVTVTCFYSPNADGSDAVIWNAEEYDQSNPLVTDANGEYEWFVPDGYWQVRYEKNGYVTGYSDWLPVPPPQTEVNFSMTSTASPEISDVYAYPDGIELHFSQYMDIESIHSDHLLVTQDEKTVAGVWVPLNEEESFDNEAVHFASIFRFIPEQGVILNGEYEIEAESVKNYTGNTAKTLCTKAKVTQRIERMEIPSALFVYTRQVKEITIQLLPAEAGKNKKLTVSSDNSMIVSVSGSPITTDETGKATFYIKGELAGNAYLMYSVENTDISGLIAVTAENETETCAAVVASIESGSTVKEGTYLTLSTKTKGAKIYYTTDSTCPCIVDSPSRIQYVEPIMLTEDVRIIAYAVKNNCYDSPKTILNYTVTPHTHSFSEWTVVTPATYEAAGLQTRICSVCRQTEEAVIPALSPQPPETELLLRDDAVLTLNRETNAIWNILPGSTVSQVLEQFKIYTNGELLCVLSGNPKTAMKPTETVKTGDCVVLKYGEKTNDFLYIVVMGDADGDGKTTASDARLALRASVGLESYKKGYPVFDAVDIDNNGKITSSDARLILRASVGLEKLSDYIR